MSNTKIAIACLICIFVFWAGDGWCQNVVSVPNRSNNECNSLNSWLARNPDKRIIGFAGILAYRAGISSFTVAFDVTTNGCQQIFKKALRMSDIKTTIGNQRLTGMTSIPAYSGGSSGYILLYETEESKGEK